MKKAAVYLLIIVSVFTVNVSLFADIEIIDLPLVYELGDFPESGYFYKIHDIAVDETSQLLYILHDSPPVLSMYYLTDGNPLEQYSLPDEMKEPISVSVCEGRKMILSNRRLWELDVKGNVTAVTSEPDLRQVQADMIKCFSTDGLLLIDNQKNRINALSWKAIILPLVAPVSTGKKGGRKLNPFERAKDIAFSSWSGIHVLDDTAGNVKIIKLGKAMVNTLELGSRNRWDGPWETISITLDTQGNLWALNKTLNSLDIYDTMGDLRYRVEQVGNEGFRFVTPEFIEADESDKIYLIDRGTNTVKVFDASGIY